MSNLELGMAKWYAEWCEFRDRYFTYRQAAVDELISTVLENHDPGDEDRSER